MEFLNPQALLLNSKWLWSFFFVLTGSLNIWRCILWCDLFEWPTVSAYEHRAVSINMRVWSINRWLFYRFWLPQGSCKVSKFVSSHELYFERWHLHWHVALVFWHELYLETGHLILTWSLCILACNCIWWGDVLYCSHIPSWKLLLICLLFGLYIIISFQSTYNKQVKVWLGFYSLEYCRLSNI